MNILLTGATGFLGSNLLAKLVSSEHNVTILIRPQSNLIRIRHLLPKIKFHVISDYFFSDLFKWSNFDLVLHCATDYGRKNINHIDMINSNLILPLHLLDFCVKYKVRQFVNTDTILDKRINAYSTSKAQFTDWLKLYADELSIINIALEHFYGYGDDNTKFVSWVINSLVSNVDQINLTSGEQSRDFIYIDDVVDAFICILKFNTMENKGYLRYEVGTGSACKIKDFCLLVKRLSNSTTFLNFGAVPYRDNEKMNYQVNISDLLKIGWKSSIDLESGINNIINLIKK